MEERLQNLLQLGALLEGMENMLIPVFPHVCEFYCN
ncbi:hypothetical protein F383_17236 [Gossypium arboreum]|uniref:Uncharacterized protein n=1 Tax=Gossypium arboreum TaxID=29729 RepID=A0A0B0NMT0_GOSAR|nr:hypothetical protein F383_17236 [Gossypium arboreum]